MPLGNLNQQSQVFPAAKSSAQAVNCLYVSVTSGYIPSMGVRLLRGRDFADSESRLPGAPPVAIIDETLAKHLFGTDDPLGQRIRYTQAPPDGSPAEMEVVGVVSQHQFSLDSGATPPWLFVPMAQTYNGSGVLCLRTTRLTPAALDALLETVRKELRLVDANLPLLRVRPYTDFFGENLNFWIIRIGAIIFGILGGTALLLAVVGVYAVKAYAVERRTREIGVRMALGADRRAIFALLIRQGAWQIAAATAFGVTLSLLAGPVLSNFAFQVSPRDPVVLLTAVAAMGGPALLACYLPARRATRVSPLTAIRSE